MKSGSYVFKGSTLLLEHSLSPYLGLQNREKHTCQLSRPNSYATVPMLSESILRPHRLENTEFFSFKSRQNQTMTRPGLFYRRYQNAGVYLMGGGHSVCARQAALLQPPLSALVASSALSSVCPSLKEWAPMWPPGSREPLRNWIPRAREAGCCSPGP